MFQSVLVANRGEIAVRVIRTLKRLGVRAVAVYSDADADAPHVRLADVAVRLGPGPAAASYLSIERVLAAAAETGAEAIHPGYGFLSENAAFVRACAAAGIAFVGPPAEAMELLGDKARAKRAAEEAGVPVLPGLQRPGLTDAEIVAFAADDGAVLPLMVKAAAGGGGRGMRVVRSAAELPEALAAARREALSGFGNDALIVERYVERARHIEMQLLADSHGGVIHLGERECSLQRRHQKVVEESPSPVVAPGLRERLGEAATELLRRAGYVGAATAEFLAPADDPTEAFFLEVNTRLQVEHPVTELVTGLDLVEEQLWIAAGEPLRLGQGEVRIEGHAIEVRVTAEDPAASFLPVTGTVATYEEPSGEGVRVDSGIAAGSTVTPHYDSLLTKVIAHGRDRPEALERLGHALLELRILGVATNAGFLARLLAAPEVRAGELDTRMIERGLVATTASEDERAAAAVAVAATAALALAGEDSRDPWDRLVSFRLEGRAPLLFELEDRDGELRSVTIEGPPAAARVEASGEQRAMSASLEGDRLRLVLDGEARVWSHALADGLHWVAAGADAFAFRLLEPTVESSEADVEGALEAPMPGTVLAVRVAKEETVSEGDVLVVLESMKMEIAVTAPIDATVAEVHVKAGDGVKQGQPLVELEAA
jgi:acetyl-CoA/propionyl-CoA carboxylase biotin carboxyl carrier protein